MNTPKHKVLVLVSILVLGLASSVVISVAARLAEAQVLQWYWYVEDPPGPQTILVGKQTGDYFGWRIVGGDVNGDGFEDLLIGARGASGPTALPLVGEVYVLSGPLPFDQTITIPECVALTLQGLPGQDYQLGTFLGSGDLNGDGYDDIVTSAWATLRSYVYLGASTIATTSPLTVSVTPSAVALTILHPDQFFSVTTCNVNGDAYDDLIVGARERVWGILGSPHISMSDPVTIDLATETVDLSIVGFNPTLWGSPEPGNLGCGDVDGDGYNDLVVGIFGESPGGRYGAGNVYVVRGSPEITYTHPITIQVPDQADAIIEGVDGGEGEAGDMLGLSLAVTDVNGDGQADLILGAPNGDGLDNSLYMAGEVYLWLGQALMGQTVDLSTEAHWVVYGDQKLSSLGDAVDGGDFDGDGRPEVLVGCDHCNKSSTSHTISGAGYVIDADRIEGAHIIPEVASLIIYPAEYSSIGYTVGVVDLDGDGIEDIGLSTAWNGDRPPFVYVLPYLARYLVWLPLISR